MKKRYASLLGLLFLAFLTLPALSDQKSTEQTEKYWNPLGDYTPLADVAEVEPNNSMATAQALGCGNVLRPASIAVATPRDTDWIYFDANAGDIINFGTDADGTTGQLGDSRIGLLKGDGTLLASDDDSGPGLYSLIANYIAPYTGRYYGRIAAYSTQTGSYKAFVTCQTPEPAPVNDRCAGAIPIPCDNISLSGSTQFATDDYNPGSGGCTGYAAVGKDVVYSIAAQPNMVLEVFYTQASYDGAIYLITDCASPSTSCVAGRDTSVTGGLEHLTYTFTTGGTYYLILDSYGSISGGSWTMTGSLWCATPSKPYTWGRLKSIYR